MRGLLVVNPVATTTTERVRDVLVTALTADLALETVLTKGRGHATELATRARETGVDVVVVLGGDGTVNEVVNGLLHAGPTGDGPALAVVPGGSTNVFARSLGYSASPVEATGELLDALRNGRGRRISLGRARYGTEDRWFTFCFGAGLDADVVAAVERKRDRGRRSTPGLFLRSAAGRLLRRMGRSGPQITVTSVGGVPVDKGQVVPPPADAPDTAGSGPAATSDAETSPTGTGGAAPESAPEGTQVELAIVCNTRPWTYLNARPVMACPCASFDTGLDLLALRSARLTSVLRTGGQVLRRSARPHGRNLFMLHDTSELTLSASAPVAMQMDGEYLGALETVVLTHHPHALRVIA